MAGKRNDKSSKTAHVLNLLTNVAPPPPLEAESAPNSSSGEAQPTPQSAPPTPTRPLVPPILEQAHKDEALSESIRSALEGALEPELAAPPAPAPVVEEPPAPAPVVEEAPAPAPVVEEVPAPGVEEAPAPAPVVEEPPAPAPVVEEPPAPAPVVVQEQRDDESICGSSPDDSLVYVNIMQKMVDEQAEKYMDLFGLCKCHRCAIDVRALALTNLPPKYMVMNRTEITALMNLYENRYHANVAAQVMQACRTVLESPRH